MERDEQGNICINGKWYRYSAEEDTYYPMPTHDEYDFQRFIMWLGGFIVFSWILYLTGVIK